MKNKKILRILSALLCVTLTAGSVYLRDEIWQEPPVSAWASSELEAKKNANDAEIAEMQKKLDDIGKDKSEAAEYQDTLSEKIDLQEKNIEIVDEQLTRIEEEIEETQADITDTEVKIGEMQVEIDADLVEFKKRIRAMYISGNDSLASALVGATDFFDFLSKYDLITRIAKHDNDLVNGLKDQITVQNEQKTHLEERKTALDAQLADQKKTRQQLKDAILELQADFEESVEYSDLLAEKEALLNDDIASLEAANMELEEEDQRIYEAILEAERIRKEKEAAEAAAAAARLTTAAKPSGGNTTYTTAKPSSGGNSSSGNNNNSSGNNNTPQTTQPAQQQTQQTTKATTITQAPVITTTQEITTTQAAPSSHFGWPCPGFYTLTSGFGPRWGTHHSGIDISSGGITGAPIVASRGGTVISVSSGCPHDYPKSSSCGCGGGYGNYVIVQHDGTYSTLYGHMSSVAVSSGQSVSQGQVLGYVGSTGFSTGAHLHFEVRVNGNRVDPEQYLY